jgi:hypothetical protein
VRFAFGLVFEISFRMLPFKLIYSDDYYLPIGAHVFPAEKYRRIHERLLESGVATEADFVTPQAATDQDILLVHTPQYVEKLKTGTLTAREELQMEVPYSPELVRAFWLAAGGSILAAQHALKDRVAFNIGGGFHHAFPDHGEGFCVIHDVAVAIRRMQRDDKIRTAMTESSSTEIYNNKPRQRRTKREEVSRVQAKGVQCSPSARASPPAPGRRGWSARERRCRSGTPPAR